MNAKIATATTSMKALYAGKLEPSTLNSGKSSMAGTW